MGGRKGNGGGWEEGFWEEKRYVSVKIGGMSGRRKEGEKGK
jgi:hypothetical protein